MSVRARQLALLVVLSFLLVVHAAQPGPMVFLGSGSDPWPAEVTVTAPRPVNIYGDRPDLRVLQLVDSMNAMWARAFADAGEEYEPPTVDTSDGPPASGCGSATDGWAGIYCQDGQRIVIDTSSQQVRAAVLGEQGADALLGYVLAHEIGHHLQKQLGTEARVRQLQAQRPQLRNNLSVPRELQADCYAGVWTADAERSGFLTIDDADVREGLSAAAAVGDDRIQQKATGRVDPESWTHGSAQQRQTWFRRGLASGDPGDCDTFAGQV